jgi:hypothetical protein
VTIGPLALSAVYSGSPNGSNNLSVQIKVDLNNALAGLTALGFHDVRTIRSRKSGPAHRTDCAKSATGNVKTFLTNNHCKLYVTATRTVAKQGVTALVAFSWVEMHTSTLAGQYKAEVDTYGTGNPPGVPHAFNGRCYTSGLQGATVWTIELRPTGNVDIDRKVLQAAARTKLTPSYLRQHCTE